MAHAITAQFPLKLAAVFFAVLLWLKVNSEEITQQWVPVRVMLVMDSAVTLRDSLPSVQALAAGKRGDLSRLAFFDHPVVRQVITDDSPDVVTLALGPEKIVVPGDPNVQIVDVRPRSIALAFDISAHARLPVRPAFRVSPDSGLHLAAAPLVAPESVEVRGSRAAVRALSTVPTEQAVIALHDTATVVRSVPLDTTGLGVTVDPASVRVRVAAARDSALAAPGDSTLSTASRPRPASPRRPFPPPPRHAARATTAFRHRP